MVFSTTIFLFLFLPLFFVGYYLMPVRSRTAWILLGSWVFYGWWRLDFLGLLVLTSIWNYVLGRVIGRVASSRSDGQLLSARIAVSVGIVLNLGSLAYFKYFNFALDSFNTVLEAAGLHALQTWSVILPIGISFYIFQATSYIVDVYRGDAPPARSFVELSAYIALFPQLIAGPILRYKDLAEQFAHRRHSLTLFSEGAYRFMSGFIKKVLIADTVAVIADSAFALDAPGFIGGWLGTLAYTSQLYFDFSGYSDMAIGLGLMMGFRFMENFNYPYISRSIAEFWRRWHISLSTWLRDYLYIPLGGNRWGSWKTCRNIMLVMLLGGLWHGAAWNFVLWGVWHGVLLLAERFSSQLRRGTVEQRHNTATGQMSLGQRVTAGILVMRTFLLVVIGWVVFRSPDMATAGRMYSGMLGLQGSGQIEALMVEIGFMSLMVLMLSLGVLFSTAWWREYMPHWWHTRLAGYVRTAVLPLFMLAIGKLLAESYSPFLYFQF